ncbi:MAG: lysostaphin resistance A-like protein [Candidatus Roseilinea sp.]|uniref:lysostaphin resistance A-like protein n=1 Tax=Candidatus Roseilinea sp. TaxID=2838777 RepID=UPI00404AE630
MDSLPQPEQPAPTPSAADDASDNTPRGDRGDPQPDSISPASASNGASSGSLAQELLTQPRAALAQAGLALQPAAPESQAPTHGLDWVIRIALWVALIALFAQQLGEPLNGPAVFPLLLFAVFVGGFLLASVPLMARALRHAAQVEPVGLSLAPLMILAPFILYAQMDGALEATDLLTSGILLYLPSAIAIINTPQFRRGDLLLGLITVATPLVLPLTRNETIDPSDAVLRIGAFLIPLALLALTSREQKRNLNFLFVCAVLSVWYAVEFEAFPDFPLFLMEGAGYFQIALLPLFLFLLAVSGQFQGIGLSFQPTARGVSIAASNLILLAVVSVPVGLFSGFLVPGFAAPAPFEAVISLLTGFVFVALPEEILFRGTIFRYLEQTLRLPQASAIVVSSVVFGLAHLNNPPDIGWYFVLATVAGVFYARTYIATRNVATPAVVHAIVNWVWAVAFSGGMR